MTKGKVCVTGASGFIASWLVKRLLESGYHVLGTVRDPGNHKKVGHLWDLEGAKERLELVRADLLEEGSFDDAVMACEGVFHTASPILTKSDSKEQMLNAAINGTLNVLRSCKKNPLLKKVVLTSSSSTVRIKADADLPPNASLDETSWSSVEFCESLQIWYAVAKILAEKAAWEFAKEHKMDLVTVLPTFVIGPNLSPELSPTASDVLGLFQGVTEKFTVYGRMGYVHIDDVASCHILAYETPGAEGRYICNSAVVNNNDLVAMLAARFPSFPIPKSFPNIYGEQTYDFNSSKARALGLEFKGVEEMFDDAVDSLIGHGYLPKSSSADLADVPHHLLLSFPLPPPPSRVCIASPLFPGLVQDQGKKTPMASGVSNGSAKSLPQWLRENGFDEETVARMSKRCKNLQNLDAGEASGVWDYLINGVKIERRKLRHVVAKCPKVLTLSVDGKLVPTVQCLATLQAKPGEVAQAIAKFPQILFHSVEEKLCPLLAFFQTLGVSEKQLAKLLMVNPRLISYSIEAKFSQTVDFFVSLGMDKEGMIGKILTKEPYIMGYSVDKRLRPTAEFLKSVVGLQESDFRRVILNFPDILSRDVKKTLQPNLDFLQSCGFSNYQVRALVAGYPHVLIKSIKHCLQPRMKFLVEEMGRDKGEVIDYPQFFRHGLKKSLEYRHKVLKQMNSSCSLSEMLDCNQKKFAMKFGLLAAV